LAYSVVITAPLGAVIAAPSPTSRAAAAGAIGLRLLDVPNGGKDPRARLYIVDHLAPGTTIDRRIEVSNTTPSSVRVELYSAAASIADGVFTVAAGHTANDVSRWTSVRPAALDIPAGGRVTATVTIAVPRDAAPGEQYGAVWAEARSAPDAAGVTQSNRVGIRLYLSIGPGGAPAADFTIDSLTAKRSPDGVPMVVASVHNTGGRALDMTGTLQLSAGPGGVSAGPFPATLGTTLAVGATEPVTIALDKALPTGKWDAQITLKSGLLERSAKATITFSAAGASAPVKAVPTRRASPVAAIAGFGVLLVTIAGLFALRRRLRLRRT
jgi:hypothetical protein